MKLSGIKNIREIIVRDFKGVFSNPIVTIVLIGLIILPSLYALLNIQACWDPYGNTGNVEFAIANLDKGATFQETNINIGDELVKDLKKNDKFKWVFVTEDELRDGVYTGKYYAGIVIPKNLSENVVSITDENPKQAKLEYLVNMKENPVGAKLTDSGSNAVYNSLNAKIVEIINLAAYGKLGELQEGLASGASQLASGGSQLQAGAAQVSDGAGQVADGESQVKDGSAAVKDGASKVQKGASDVSTGANKVKQGSTAVKDGAGQVEQGAEELETAVDPSLIPEGPVKEYAEGVGQLSDGASQVAGGASQLADGSVELAEGSLALAAGSQLLSNAAAQALFTAAGSLGASANQLAGITGINETILGDYFFSPIKLDRHEVFTVPDYGSQVSPFYLVLSMWGGGLITCALLRPGTSHKTKYTPLEMYAGKLVLFNVMSILQVSVTIIGAHILGIYIDNELLFIISSLIVSGVFMTLIYSFVSALGDVGKAVAIVLLVIQISGTGGIYPVEIMAPFFNVMNPYLPMTYAITLIREAQLGVIWANYIPALVILFAIAIITVVVSILVKKRADRITHYFENRLEDSGLF